MPVLTSTTRYASRAEIATPITTHAVAFLQESIFLGVSAGTTFASQNVGLPTGGRVVYVVLTTRGTTGVTLSSATIGGVSATIHCQVYETFVGSDDGVAIFSAAVPTGTSADVVTAFSGNVTRQYIGVYRVAAQTAVDDSDFKTIGSTNNTGTLTLTTVAGGSLICGCSAQAGTGFPRATYTNATENYDLNVNDVQCSAALATGIAGASLGVSAALSEANCQGGFAAVSFH